MKCLVLLLPLLAACSQESLPHRPMSEIDLQGHQDLLGPQGHMFCDGHVQEIIKYPDGDVLIVCRPAQLEK